MRLKALYVLRILACLLFGLCSCTASAAAKCATTANATRANQWRNTIGLAANNDTVSVYFTNNNPNHFGAFVSLDYGLNQVDSAQIHNPHYMATSNEQLELTSERHLHIGSSLGASYALSNKLFVIAGASIASQDEYRVFYDNNRRHFGSAYDGKSYEHTYHRLKVGTFAGIGSDFRRFSLMAKYDTTYGLMAAVGYRF
ncbi:hypothetical protein [Paraferrimonas haliotis]|uniref:Outer membrane protein beta-barrel domain-containing protein n=1 Tax=Paraferrimonas haliotis TaxID=2013866 RepID=A0AA37TRU6_9GAMM|nr:hypothetical protein [Paraferrimonas haliotis]GLS84090.1 hypothetical protein GCM10007894_20670 [Paraferrimonas haliotis]